MTLIASPHHHEAVCVQHAKQHSGFLFTIPLGVRDRHHAAEVLGRLELVQHDLADARRRRNEDRVRVQAVADGVADDLELEARAVLPRVPGARRRAGHRRRRGQLLEGDRLLGDIGPTLRGVRGRGVHPLRHVGDLSEELLGRLIDGQLEAQLPRQHGRRVSAVTELDGPRVEVGPARGRAGRRPGRARPSCTPAGHASTRPGRGRVWCAAASKTYP